MSLIARTIVPQWFVEKRGRALAMLNLGGVLSQTAFPLVNTLMIEAIGWRWAWRFWASLVGLFFAPIALFFYRDTPFFYGWIICAVAALMYFFSGPGQTYSMSFFISAYQVRIKVCL